MTKDPIAITAMLLISTSLNSIPLQAQTGKKAGHSLHQSNGDKMAADKVRGANIKERGATTQSPGKARGASTGNDKKLLKAKGPDANAAEAARNAGYIDKKEH